MNDTLNNGNIEYNITNKYENELAALKLTYKDELNNQVVGISYKQEEIKVNLQNIEYELNSYITSLTKRIESVVVQIDKLERQRNYHQRQNGSNIGEQLAFEQSQETLGNQLQEIRRRLTGYEYSRDMMLEQLRAKKDFFKSVLGKEWVPFNSSRKKEFTSKTNEMARKKKQLEVVSKFWNSKKAGDIPVVIKDSEIIPAIV